MDKKTFKRDTKHIWSTEISSGVFPPEVDSIPEVAFIGRSNVGKSSLINSLVNRNKLARTSNTPGATRAVHFYEVDEAVRLVDLPGYGYAKLSKTLSAQIAALIESYINDRRTLKKIFVLIDGRRGIKEMDLEAIGELTASGISVQLLITKADKMKDAEKVSLTKSIEENVNSLNLVDDEIILTSSVKGYGMDELRHTIMKL